MTKDSQNQAEYFEAGKGSGIGKPNHCTQSTTGSAVRGWCCLRVSGAVLVL